MIISSSNGIECLQNQTLQVTFRQSVMSYDDII